MPRGPAGRSRTSRSHFLPQRRLSSRSVAVERLLAAHHAVDEDARRRHRLGVESARLDDLVDLGDRHPRRSRQDRIEVARAAAVDEVAAAVGARGADEREVGAQRRLEQVAAAVELAHLLAVAAASVPAPVGV